MAAVGATKRKGRFLLLIPVLAALALACSAAAANVDTNKGWHPMQQISLDSTNLASVDSNSNRAIDTSDACQGDLICEVDRQIDFMGAWALVQAMGNNLELKTSDPADDIYLNTRRVGIGTAAPAAKLHVHNSGVGQAAIRFSNAENQFGWATDNGNAWLYDYTDSAYRLFVDTDGNVGIGTATLQTKGGGGSYITVDDVYLSEIDRWASEIQPDMGTTVYQTPGQFGFIVPPNATVVRIKVWGGGGGGGRATGSDNGGGGGGGAYGEGELVTVTPGATYIVKVGAGGAGGKGAGATCNNGGNSSFENETGGVLIKAGGGKFGRGRNCASGTSAGGAYSFGPSSDINPINYGDGGNGNLDCGTILTDDCGYIYRGCYGGDAAFGGEGGYASYTGGCGYGYATSGSWPGGGGGGGYYQEDMYGSCSSLCNGADGANGKVIINWWN